MQEHELRELGIFRIPVPIPFPGAGGPANVYVIEEECGLMLFDTGLGTGPCQEVLAQGLAQTGHRFEEVNRIVLSHGHIDHFGAAEWVREQAGRPIPILIHRADEEKVLQSGDDWPALLRRNGWYLCRLGVPQEAVDEAIIMLAQGTGFGRRLSDTIPLLDGDTFQCRHVTLEVHPMPGHTPGVCCLYERDHRLLFSADHLLEHVSPNPLIELSNPGSFKPLISYFRSLDRVRSLSVDLVLPGHAKPFTKPLEVVESLCGFYRQRQEKILGALDGQSLTPYQVMRELFLGSSGFELVLMLSEALGNLELLEERGTIERVTDDECIRFRSRRGVGPCA